MEKNATDKLKSAMAYLRATEGKGLIAAYADTYGNVLHDAEAVLAERVFTESEVKKAFQEIWDDAVVKGYRHIAEDIAAKHGIVLDPA